MGGQGLLLCDARSFLFVPGDRPERFAKAAASGADVVVVDLEDAVAAGAKAQARDEVAAWLAAGNRAVVRVNAPLTELFTADVEAVREDAQAVMIAKAEPGQDWSALGSAAIVPLIETARGLTGAAQLLADPRVVRPALGTIDLAVELGIDPDDQQALLWARSGLVAAAAAAGVGSPVDGVTTRIDDADTLAADVAAARRLGLRAKLCIHPRQIAAVHDGLRASAAEAQWARAVLAAATDGVSTVDGAMIDAPVVNRARQLLATLG